MNSIDPKNTSIPATTATGAVAKVQPVDDKEARKFSEMIKEDTKKTAKDTKNSQDMPTINQIRKNVVDSMVRKGIERTIEKARDIGKGEV